MCRLGHGRGGKTKISTSNLNIWNFKGRKIPSQSFQYTFQERFCTKNKRKFIACFNHH